MREERGQLQGEVIVYELFTLWGSVMGNVRVIEGGKFYARGTIHGNLTVEEGGRCHIYGNVSGTLRIAPRAKVIHSGYVAGDAINAGGRLYIDYGAKIGGKVDTVDEGETRWEPKSNWKKSEK